MKTMLFSLGVLLMPIAAAADFPATVKTVKDGDTLVVTDRDGKDTTIRLYGIDTPEDDQEGGGEAEEALKIILPEQAEVIVSPVDRDQYKRTVAIVYAGETPANALMLEYGHAWLYPQFCKKPVCGEWKILEDAARESRIGLWSQDNPIPPWKYRAEKRKSRKGRKS